MNKGAAALFGLCLLLTSCTRPSRRPDFQAGAQPKQAPPELQEQARSRQISQVGYAIWLGLQPTAPEFEGRTVIRFVLRDGTLRSGTELAVDLFGAAIRTVAVNESPWPEAAIRERYDGKTLKIPASALESGSNRVEVSYTRLYSKDGVGLVRIIDPADEQSYVYTQRGEASASRIFPCFDQPDLMARIELTLETPEDWVAVSTGEEDEGTPVDGRKSWGFTATPELSPGALAIAAGPFTAFQAKGSWPPLRVLARASQARSTRSAELLAGARRELARHALGGELNFPFSKLDLLMAGEGLKPQTESAGVLSLPLSELARSWFGVALTGKSQRDREVLDGLVAFLGFEARASAESRQKTWLDFYLKVKRPALAGGKGPGLAAAAFRQLQFALGEKEFARILGRLWQENAYAAVDSLALFETLGSAGPDWGEAWLGAWGVDEVEPVWSCQPNKPGGPQVVSEFKLRLRPGSSPLRFPRVHRTRVGFFRKGQARPRVAFDAAYSHPESAPAEALGKPCPDFVFIGLGDPDLARSRLDQVSSEAAWAFLPLLEDPLLRAQLWQTLWDATAVGESSAQSFLDRARETLPLERDDQVLAMALEEILGPRLFELLPEQTRSQALAKTLAWVEERAQAPRLPARLKPAWTEALARLQAMKLPEPAVLPSPAPSPLTSTRP